MSREVLYQVYLQQIAARMHVDLFKAYFFAWHKPGQLSYIGFSRHKKDTCVEVVLQLSHDLATARLPENAQFSHA